MTNHLTMFVGTYTERPTDSGERSKGIYICQLDMETGEVTPVKAVGGIVNPSYVVVHPSGNYLYSVSEVEDTDGQPTGGVSAFAISDDHTNLAPLNSQLSHGTAPCHVSVDATGGTLLVANYGSGSIAAYPIRSDGSLGEASTMIQHEGSSVNPQRQQGPHAHSINLDPANRRAFVADLGMDKVMIYELDVDIGSLTANNPASVSVTPGAGPRHFDFHPSEKYAYLINEIGSTVTAFDYDAANGALNEIQTIATLPDGFDAKSSTADIHVSPDGRFLYGSNRGHDSIVIYAIDQTTGRLTLVGHESTQGRIPRNFAIDPGGTILLAANQDTDNIVTFWIDQESGKLTPTGFSVSVPRPVCVKLIA